MSATIKLHGILITGYCHRIELALSQLGLPYETVPVDLRAGAHKKPEFLALNPFGQVPVLDDGGTVIADSNAILAYLGAKYDDGTLMPRDPIEAAAVQRWFSVAAGEIRFGPGAARLVKVFGAPLDHAAASAIAARIAVTGRVTVSLRRSITLFRPCVSFWLAMSPYMRHTSFLVVRPLCCTGSSRDTSAASRHEAGTTARILQPGHVSTIAPPSAQTPLEAARS